LKEKKLRNSLKSIAMNSIPKINIEEQPWFQSWFNSKYYHQLYCNRDETEAKNFIDALIDELQPTYKSLMLDVGCGAGRHSKYLASKGYNVTGFDLAFSSIREARKFESSSLQFRQHDMRIPFGKNRFDYVFNFFTSFGYFKNATENNQVVSNMSAALKPGGLLLIDYLNVQYTEEHIIAVEEKEIDGVWYHINRWSDDRFIYKRIAIHDVQAARPLEYVEQVAKLRLKDFKELFHSNGLQIVNLYGNYELSKYDSKTSKRLIIAARKK